MSQFWEKIRELFSRAGNKKEPVIHEVLVRDEEDIEAYEQWKNSERRLQLLEMLKNSFEDKFSTDDHAIRIDYIEGASSNGFMFYFEDHLEEKDFQHFFDYLKEKILENNYKSYLSDSKSFAREDHVELKERHYLKPALNFNKDKSKVDQQYGNITIEHVKHDDRPQHISFRASYYVDHKYSEALDLDELLERIFT